MKKPMFVIFDKVSGECLVGLRTMSFTTRLEDAMTLSSCYAVEMFIPQIERELTKKGLAHDLIAREIEATQILDFKEPY